MIRLSERCKASIRDRLAPDDGERVNVTLRRIPWIRLFRFFTSGEKTNLEEIAPPLSEGNAPRAMFCVNKDPEM